MFRAIGNSMRAREFIPNPGARTALALLLGINLFNYIDRFVLAAVEPNIRAAFFAPGDPNAMTMTGLLAPVERIIDEMRTLQRMRREGES